MHDERNYSYQYVEPRDDCPMDYGWNYSYEYEYEKQYGHCM
jgi:hypothetical protein